MITMDKPPLDEELLAHYGIPGMKWGQRKAPDPLVGRQPAAAQQTYGGGRQAATGQPQYANNSQSAQPSYSAPRSGGVAPQRRGMSKGAKIAIGVAGLAAAGYFLSKTGTKPSARAMTGASNRIGRQTVVGLMKTYGRVGVSTLKAAPKVTGTAAKATYKTSRFAGKTAFRATKSVSKASANSVKTAIENLKNTPATKASPVRGKAFGNMLLGNYGKAPASALNPLSSFRQVMADRAIRRSLSR